MRYCNDCRFKTVCNIIPIAKCKIYEPSILKKIKDYVNNVIQQLKHKHTTEE